MSPEEDLFRRLHNAEAVKPTASLEASEVEKEMTKSDPDAGTPISIRNLFTHHDTHPIVLDFALLKTFGLEWLNWESETIYAEVHRLFNSQISEHARAKIQVLKTLHLSDMPWAKWQVFEKVIQGLNNNIPRWDVMQAPAIEQLYAGVDMMNTLRKVDFSEEVKLYMASAVLHEDVLYVPPPLEFVQPHVAQPHYLCRDCGNEDSALFHDGVCDTCTRKFAPGSTLAMEPDPAAIKAGRGKNLQLVLKFDPTPAEKRWNEVKAQPMTAVALQENETDTQVAKLLVARDYMNVRRKQLAEQLTALKSWLGAA